MRKETKKQSTTLVQPAFGHVTSSQQEKLTNTFFKHINKEVKLNAFEIYFVLSSGDEKGYCPLRDLLNYFKNSEW